MDSRPKTLFIDIDGCIFVYNIKVVRGHEDPVLLPGSLDKMLEWKDKGYNLIITTGRHVDLHNLTQEQLKKSGVPYDLLIMGIGGGVRVLINDTKPDGEITAKSYSLDRDAGLGGVEE